MSSVWGCLVCGLLATERRVVVLGTGGTIAGTGNDPLRAWAYQAAQLSVSQLVAVLPELADVPIETHQVAQIDSKDMGWLVWRDLARALAQHLSRDDVAGVVITHGTDTLEETSWLLHALHDGRKPVVLTAAMRPATAPDADGPRNLRDAVLVVQEAAERGECSVWVQMHGKLWSAVDARKAHTHALDAFDGGGQLPLAEVIAGTDAERSSRRVSWSGPAPACKALGWAVMERSLPRVELVCSHADADGWLVHAMLAHSSATGHVLKGVVVACTGNGTLHTGLTDALRQATQQGVIVWRSSRVARGGVLADANDEWPGVPHLTSVQARIALMLSIMGYPVL